MGRLWCGENSPDDLIMVPLDIRALADKGASFWDLCDNLGPKAAAEAFLRAREHFEVTKAEVPNNERCRPITSLEWKQYCSSSRRGGEPEANKART